MTANAQLDDDLAEVFQVSGRDDGRGIPSATNVDHFGVIVPDLPQAVQFFTELLGADLIFTFDEGPGTKNPADLNAAFGVPKDSKLKIAMLRLGPTVNLELMQYESSEQRQVMPKNSDFDTPHIAFFVSDMDAAARYFADHGCKLFSGPLLSKARPQGRAVDPLLSSTMGHVPENPVSAQAHAV